VPPTSPFILPLPTFAATQPSNPPNQAPEISSLYLVSPSAAHFVPSPAACTKLTSLCMERDDSHMVLFDEDVTLLTDLKALRNLCLGYNTSLTEIGVSKLAAFTRLQFLDLSSCSPQSLGGLAHLQGLPLQWLRLGRGSIERNSLPGMLRLAFDRASPTSLTSKWPNRPSMELVHRLCQTAGNKAKVEAVVGISHRRACRGG